MHEYLQARMVTHQDLAQQPPGTPIIVFIARNGVAASAVNVAANLARPGRDKLILVTFVPTPMQMLPETANAYAASSCLGRGHTRRHADM
ncbi:hypothetical protein DUNSADRAFT_3462 [Dunaliella salina]|uniref:Uncharacterized protein n=1 Tax=Dunaliella salina TaxID=3046 RepID=A0ABQ7FVD8_DUNSA|nr:hypothetical protein DUNSADRAFT_3462 [Dunaliella salina]|eukprot:KAF5826349.1 hypothetical protein DUNSADRAFT_3462 [Dunaliella salina]